MNRNRNPSFSHCRFNLLGDTNSEAQPAQIERRNKGMADSLSDGHGSPSGEWSASCSPYCSLGMRWKESRTGCPAFLSKFIVIEWRGDNELIDDPRWDGYEVPPTSNANYGWILNIVSKLSQNGVAGFLLANGALSDDGTELKIRRQLIENNLVEAIIILPRNLFYTTDISVTLWILNKNKKARVVEENGEVKRFRNREREILFMDLRQMGSPYEKKYIELTEEDRKKVTSVYHAWQQEGYEETYQNVPEFCYSASFDEVAEKGFTLVPSRYIEFVNRDENIDFDTKMKTLQSELRELLVAEEKSKADLLTVFKELGYEIEL